jgi:hypothetical protein
MMLDGMKPPLTTSGAGPTKRLDRKEHIREEHIRTLSLRTQYSGGAPAVASKTRGAPPPRGTTPPQYLGTRNAWGAIARIGLVR